MHAHRGEQAPSPIGPHLFDTAEAYGPFKNEELVGEALAPFRENDYRFSITEASPPFFVFAVALSAPRCALRHSS